MKSVIYIIYIIYIHILICDTYTWFCVCIIYSPFVFIIYTLYMYTIYNTYAIYARAIYYT